MPEAPQMPAWCRIDANLAVAKIQIRDVPDACDQLASTIGVQPPRPNRWVARHGLALTAVAPGEWLLTGNADDVAAALERAEAAFRAQAILALDLTHGCVVLRLDGAAGRSCLAALCPLDLRPEHFTVGAAARTRFGDIGVFVAHLGDAPAFLLIADQSNAPYVLHLIARSAIVADHNRDEIRS